MANKHPNTSNLRPPWQPGQSGNPNGAPTKERRAKKLLRSVFGEQAKKLYNLTQEELDEWDGLLISITTDQLKAIIQVDQAPAYLKAQAVAILTDMKNGRTTTVERLADRLYSRNKPRRVEVTGKDGADLITPRILTKDEAADFLDQLNKDY